MKKLLVATLILVSSSAQVAFATTDGCGVFNFRSSIEAACEAQTLADQWMNSSEPRISCSTLVPKGVLFQYDVADSLAETSFRIMKFRIVNKNSLSLESRLEMEELEIKLYRLMVVFRGCRLR